jgi:ribosomal protein L28
MTERKAKARAKQIPFGNDRKKSKGKSKRRFPSGMTAAKANADSLRE